MKTDELTVFRNISRFRLLCDLAKRIRQGAAKDALTEDAPADIGGCVHELIEFASVHGFSGNLFCLYLTERLVNDENAFSLACESLRGAQEGESLPAGSLQEAALSDMRQIASWYAFDWKGFAARCENGTLQLICDYRSPADHSYVYSHSIRNEIASLNRQLMESSADPARMLSLLGAFYARCGAGALGLHKGFRVEAKKDRALIMPIRNIRHVRFSDLVGYEDAKRALAENTEAFLEGRGGNNCLLYGDAGTGKSTSIKAIANEYFPRGLRVIELFKHQAQLLSPVIDQIKNRHYKFIIYMDDLSFEEFETDYKYLKAVIEGGLEKRPDNVLIYATSNRRHLIRESFRDKPDILDDDIHRFDTVQEKLSLAYRFGLTVYFGAPSRAAYEEIVLELAHRAGIQMDDEALLQEAARFEMSHGGKSGRTATQLVDLLKGRQR